MAKTKEHQFEKYFELIINTCDELFLICVKKKFYNHASIFMIIAATFAAGPEEVNTAVDILNRNAVERLCFKSEESVEQ